MSALTSYIFLAIVIFLIGNFIFRIITDPDLRKIKPFTFSIVAISLLILNWLLYLSSFYELIPEKISHVIFLPVWVLSSIIGITATFREYKNNSYAAFVLGWLTIVTLAFGGFLLLIG